MRLEKVFCTTKASYISRSRPAAPWSNPPLSKNEVPAVLLIQWRQAENRRTCAALAPKDLGQYPNAQPISLAAGRSPTINQGCQAEIPMAAFAPTAVGALLGLLAPG